MSDKEKFEAWVDKESPYRKGSTDFEFNIYEKSALSTWPMIEKLVEALSELKAMNPSARKLLTGTVAEKALKTFRKGLENE